MLVVIPHVTRSYPAGLDVVFADFPNKSPETIDSFMRSLSVSAGKRISNESLVKKGVKFSVNGTMKQAVANTCLVNISWLRVRNSESLIAAVTVSFCSQITMKRNDIIHQTQTEFLHIQFFPFSFHEFLPSAE